MNHFILKTEPVRNWHIFLALLFIHLLLSWIFQEYIMTREAYHSLLSEQLETYRIDKQLEVMSRFKIWGYIILPVILWLKFTCMTLLLQLPLMFKFIEIPFKKIFRVVMLASLPFVFMSAIHILQLFSIPAEQINDAVLKIIPFSLGRLINPAHYPESAIQILNMINIFEAGWLLLTFYGFTVISENKLQKMDIALLVFAIWTFVLILQYLLNIYIEKIYT
jgi:hypothetical protein